MPAYGDRAPIAGRSSLDDHLEAVHPFIRLSPCRRRALVFRIAYGWCWWVGTPAWCGVQGFGFSGLIIGVLVECVGDVVCDVLAGGCVDVVWVCPDWFSVWVPAGAFELLFCAFVA